MTYRIRILFSLIPFLFVNCGKTLEDPFAEISDSVCGDYFLESASFSKTLNLNNDGIGSGDLLDEFKELQGYLPSKNFASVREMDGKRILIDYYVPYHASSYRGDEFVSLGCAYQEACSIGTWEKYEKGEMSWKDETFSGFSSIPSAGVKEAAVVKLEGNVMWIYVTMEMIDGKGEKQYGVLYMHFRRGHIHGF